MTGRAAGSIAPEWAAPATRRPSPSPAQDTGAVTVEAALALCALTVFLALALGALIAVAQTMRCADAARELARLAARGEPDRGRAVAARLAPPARGWISSRTATPSPRWCRRDWSAPFRSPWAGARSRRSKGWARRDRRARSTAAGAQHGPTAPGRPWHRRRTPDAGVATVWAAAAVAVLTTVLAACLHLGAALLARHRAESAADLAALAAAREAVRGEAPACRRAAEIAAAMGGEVARCRLVGWNALVEVRVAVPFALPGLDDGERAGHGRAGSRRATPGSASGRWVPAGGPPRRAPWAQPTCAARRAIRRTDGALVVASNTVPANQ